MTSINFDQHVLRVVQAATELDSYFDAEQIGTLDDKEVLGKLNAYLFAMFPRFGTNGEFILLVSIFCS